MRTPPTFNWSPSIFTFIFIFIFPFILVCAAPAPEVDSQDHTPIATLFPRLIVPVKEEFRDEAYNTMFTGDIRYTPSAGNEIRLFVSFNVPSNGARCYIKFELPKREDDPNGFRWVVMGSGRLDVFTLDGTFIVGDLTWDNRPGRTPASPIAHIVQPINGGVAAVDGAGIPCRGGRLDLELAITRGSPRFSRFYWYELDWPKSGITIEVYK